MFIFSPIHSRRVLTSAVSAGCTELRNFHRVTVFDSHSKSSNRRFKERFPVMWVCASCTFENADNAKACDVCDKKTALDASAWKCANCTRFVVAHGLVLTSVIRCVQARLRTPRYELRCYSMLALVINLILNAWSRPILPRIHSQLNAGVHRMRAVRYC